MAWTADRRAGQRCENVQLLTYEKGLEHEYGPLKPFTLDSPYFVAARPYKIHYDPRFTLRKVPLSVLQIKTILTVRSDRPIQGNVVECFFRSKKKYATLSVFVMSGATKFGVTGLTVGKVAVLLAGGARSGEREASRRQ